MSKFRASGKRMSDGPARSNTGSSIRGKISAPIIIADNDEFPLRLPGTGLPTPIEDVNMESQLALRNSTVSPTLLVPDAIGDVPRISLPPPPQPSYEPPPPPTNKPSVGRTSMGTIEGNPSRSSYAKPQRKKSSLGSVLKKLFGGKKQRNSVSSNIIPQSPGGFKAGQYRSDPTPLNRPKDSSTSQKRSVSLTIDEFNRGLRSHSVVVGDLPVDGDLTREAIQAAGKTRPRRATTPSRLRTPSRAPGYADWTGLSPRPVSTSGRQSRLLNDAEAAAVGIAITSGSHPNRRSRSLGELRVGIPVNLPVRRRSDEIKYWRESYDLGLLSPMSSNKPDGEDPIELEPPEVPQDAAPGEQPQPFNFGPVGEMAGMKITQAASLETRVQRLEDRMIQLEKAVFQMQQRPSRDPLVLQDPPRKNSRDRSVSANRTRRDNSEIVSSTQPRYRELQQADTGPYGSQKRSSSYGSSRLSTISTQNSYNPAFDSHSRPIPSSDEQTLVSVARPISTSTIIRGMSPSSPIMFKEAQLAGERYTLLTNMILAEQAARRDLEALVQNLQHQLQDLRPSKGPTSFPTPKSDKAVDFIQPSSGNRWSTFEHDCSDDEGQFAEDDFQTPNEVVSNFSDAIFGDVNGDHMNVSRTLSLSRMTQWRV